jgi:ribosomal protein L11 methylase PrmA
MSGFYTEDLPDIKAKAFDSGFSYKTSRTRNNWVAVIFEKNP